MVSICTAIALTKFHDEFLWTPNKSFLTGVGLCLLDLPSFRLDMYDDPNIFLVIFTSSTVTGRFLMVFIQSDSLQFTVVGVLTIWHNFLASLVARLNWRNLYPLWFSVIVILIIKLLVPVSVTLFFRFSFCKAWIPHIGI